MTIRAMGASPWTNAADTYNAHSTNHRRCPHRFASATAHSRTTSTASSPLLQVPIHTSMACVPGAANRANREVMACIESTVKAQT